MLVAGDLFDGVQDAVVFILLCFAGYFISLGIRRHLVYLLLAVIPGTLMYGVIALSDAAGTVIYRVAGDGMSMTATKLLLIGGGGETQLDNGVVIRLPAAMRPAQIVINDSDHAVVVRSVHYGPAGLTASDRDLVRVAPHTAGTSEHAIDFVGGKDYEPPASIAVAGVGGVRYWLTWE